MSNVIDFPPQATPEYDGEDQYGEIKLIPTTWAYEQLVKQLVESLVDFKDDKTDFGEHFNAIDKTLSLLLLSERMDISSNRYRLIMLMAQLSMRYASIDDFYADYPAIADVITEIMVSENPDSGTLRQMAISMLGDT